MPFTIVFLFCVEVCRECAENYDCLKKVRRLARIKNKVLPNWQRDTLPLSYARLLVNVQSISFLNIKQEAN